MEKSAKRSASPLEEALRHLEVAEANLVKLEHLWSDISQLIPDAPAFGSTPEYEDKLSAYQVILPYLNKIDGWSPSAIPMEYDMIGQARMDLIEIGEFEASMSFENEVQKPGHELRKYRFLLNQKRRQITREAMLGLIERIDTVVKEMAEELIFDDDKGLVRDVSKDKWEKFGELIGQVDVLLGSNERPPRWGDMMRHMRFAKYNDLLDLKGTDWPSIKKGIMASIYEGDPIPPEIGDLATLVTKELKGTVSSELKWAMLNAAQFERLIFLLISSSDGYENPQWLMQTNAADRGRDLSVDRIIKDSLGSVERKRVIVQCKHWLSKSISMQEVAILEAQMKHWEPPRVDICIIATTGRFSADAVVWIEKHNQSDKALMIEMWPESRLESILAKRPDLVGEFMLR